MSLIATIVKDCLYERITDQGEYLTLDIYRDFIEGTRRTIFGERFPGSVAKSVFRYDIKANTFEYWPSYIFFIREVEKRNVCRSHKLKLLSGFVLSTALIPGHVRLDSRTLVYMFSKTTYSISDERVFEPPVKKYYTGIQSDMAKKRELWKRLFNFENLPRIEEYNQKKATFACSATCDGISINFLFSTQREENEEEEEENEEEDAAKKKKKKKKKETKKETKTNKETETLTEENEENAYLHSITGKDRAALVKGDKKLVSIDPGKSDIWFCVQKQDHLQPASQPASQIYATSRLTQSTRRNYQRVKKNRSIRYLVKKNYGNIICRPKTKKYSVFEMERRHSIFNQKTMRLDKFRAYVKSKLCLNSKLKALYELKIFRKLRYNTYVQGQKLNSWTLRHFREDMGPPSDVILFLGDYSAGNYHMKFVEPTIGIGMRRLFQRAGYKIYLVDEYRTSKTCHKCFESSLEKFRWVRNPKPRSRKKFPWIQSNGLLRCPSCGLMCNR